MTPPPSVLLLVALFWTVPAALAALFYRQGGAPLFREMPLPFGVSGSFERSSTSEAVLMDRGCTDVLFNIGRIEVSATRVGTAVYSNDRDRSRGGRFQSGPSPRDRSEGLAPDSEGLAGPQKVSPQVVSAPVPTAEASATVETPSGPETRCCRVVLN